MVRISDVSFAIFDAGSGQVETVDPDEGIEIPQGSVERGFSEKATELLYKHHFDWHVEQINQRRKSGRLRYALGVDERDRSRSWEMPSDFGDYVVRLLRENTDTDSDVEALQRASIDGIPDFITCSSTDYREFQFVEAKRGTESLQQTQVEWFEQFDFFTSKIAYVFDEPADRDQFVAANTLSDLFGSAHHQPAVADIGGRQELSSNEIADRVATLEVGDWVVLNERKQPLEVVATDVVRDVRDDDEPGVAVMSSSGNRYLLSASGEFFVEKDNRRNLKWVQRVSET